MSAVRRAVVDGLFYPAAPAALLAQVANYLAGVGADDDASHPPPKLLVSPHAGYEYCGAVAAHAYALLGRRRAPVTRRVVLLGPAHRVPLLGLAAPKADAFETPLGEVALDLAALASVGELPQVVRSDRAHEREHSLEVQLPFLQTLFVISSDLSHYLPYAQAQAVDRATVRRILRLEADLTPHDACGAAAINGALLAARSHDLVPRLLDLRNSGDTGGGFDRVVGYRALAFEERST